MFSEIILRCIHIIMIISGGILLQSVLSFVIARHIAEEKKKDEAARINRKETLAVVASNALAWVIGFVCVIFCLERMKVPLKTLLAVSGIGAVVVGIGARSIIKDFFASILIVMESQYFHGDFVRIYGPMPDKPFEGIVENVSVRVTQIRARDGSLIFIPNGTITSVTNTSRGPFKFRVDLEVDQDIVSAVPNIFDELNDLCLNFEHVKTVERVTSLGITSTKKESVVFTYVVYASADTKNDIEAMIQRNASQVLMRHKPKKE